MKPCPLELNCPSARACVCAPNVPDEMVQAARPEWRSPEPDFATRLIAEAEKGAFDASQFLSDEELGGLDSAPKLPGHVRALIWLCCLSPGAVILAMIAISIWGGK